MESPVPFVPLLLTIPHSGEMIPEEADWLRSIDSLTLLTDVDRFVDQLYSPASEQLGIPTVVAECHRYVVDLNRLPTDVDSSLVEGASDKVLGFVSGFHWAKTTKGAVLLTIPLTQALHAQLTARYHDEFHKLVKEAEEKIIQKSGGLRFHIDAHSMPSVGTGAHKDNGATRPDVVISDCEGKSCDARYKDVVIEAFQSQGFSVSYNWPYLGGRMTQKYGDPENKKHSLQIELNRSLYMDEVTREKNERFLKTSQRITAAIDKVISSLAHQMNQGLWG